MKRYDETDADNARWDGFEFRSGDIVIAAPSKSGTTWTQLLVALLVFDGPDFPEPIAVMSPWLEQKTRPVEEAHAILEAQTHRRFIKSHTPLDGIPLVDDVRYVCVGRDPRDAAVSMLHQSDNLDRERLAELIGISEMPGPVGTFEERLGRWVAGGEFPVWSARYLLNHYVTFWERRDLPNVELFHFADYQADLPGEVGRLAQFLDIELPDGRAEAFAAEASIDRARQRVADIIPEAHLGVFKDNARFLRGGRSGDGLAALTPDQQAQYDALVGEIVSEELAQWIHSGAIPGAFD